MPLPSTSPNKGAARTHLPPRRDVERGSRGGTRGGKSYMRRSLSTPRSTFSPTTRSRRRHRLAGFPSVTLTASRGHHQPRRGGHVMHIAGLWRYPAKSLAGEALSTAQLTDGGISGDRIVHVADPHGPLTGRTRHRLLIIPAATGPDGVPQVASHPWHSPQTAEGYALPPGPAPAWSATPGRNASTCSACSLPLMVRRPNSAPTSAGSGPICSSAAHRPVVRICQGRAPVRSPCPFASTAGQRAIRPPSTGSIAPCAQLAASVAR